MTITTDTTSGMTTGTTTGTTAAAVPSPGRPVPVPVPDSIGQFPPLPDHVAPLLTITQATTAVRMTMDFRDIACFTGAPGTGKTTAVTQAVARAVADEAAGAPAVKWRYCVPPQRATPKGAMLALYESIFGWTGPLNEREATDAVVRRLAEGDLGVVIDEVHHVGLLGMQQYRHVWDRACIYEQAFPMLLVGCDVRQTLAGADEVRTRIARWVMFDHIQHPDDLAILAGDLHPRLAATSERSLTKINTDITGGNIRAWFQFAKHIDYLPSTDPARPTRLTGEDVRHLRRALGVL
ncbi:ATP-binding protein [Nocardioides abyssi]|uniref:ATP-binding protein n=1 Tax=Nocardioides abyssi TaxID=3058370 RepID=A0ABT8ESM9_9ACTN|nr:ATP-binding protein [Nocardioides abyssi]MDN4161129.1 ATP-binding protein [Nocardioides abyssi]